jgi:putative aldouronate transport system substrate-binding protein
MKRSSTSIMILILLVSILLGACTGQKDGNATRGKTPADKGKQIKEGNQPDHSGEKTGWKKDTSPITFTMLIDHSWYPKDTWGKDEISQEITKRTGVNIELGKTTDSSQLQVLLAGDELPELVFTDNLVERFHSPNICYAWDELIEEYAPEFMDLITPLEIVNNTAPDGHFYTIRTHFSGDEDWADPRNLPSPGTANFNIRTDILEGLGNPRLESLEDLVDIYKKVKTKYPDMLIHVKRPNFSSAIAETMGLVPPTNPYSDGNKVYLGISDPGTIDYFRFVNNLVRKGYLDMETTTYELNQLTELANAGKIFAGENIKANNEVFREKGQDYEMQTIENVLTYKGEIRYKMLDIGIGWSSFFITKKCKDPERAIRFAEFLKSPEGDELTQWGVEGVHYTLNEDGLLERPEKYASLQAQEDAGLGLWYFQASRLAEGISVTSRALSDPDQESLVKWLQNVKPYTERNFALFFAVPQAETKAMTMQAKIGDLIEKATPELFNASTDKELDQKFEGLYKACEEEGLKELEKGMTREYIKAKDRYK